MTASDVQAGTWAPVGPPFSSYEASDGQPDGNGQVRSIDGRVNKGRRYQGKILATTISNRGYVLVKVYDDDGVRQTRTVHSLQMMAFEGPCPPGMQIRHWNDDGQDNRWAPGGEANCGPGKPGNLVHGTWKQNRADMFRNRGRHDPSLPRRAGRARTAARNAASRLRRWSA